MKINGEASSPEEPSPARDALWRIVGEGLLAAIPFTLLMLLLFHRHGFDVAQKVVGDALFYDWRGQYWNIWRGGQFLRGLGPLFSSQMVFFPQGVNLVAIMPDPLVTVIGGLFSLFVSLPAAHFGLVLFAIVGNAYGGYVLARSVTGSRWAGLAAMPLLGFNGHLQWTLTGGHFDYGVLIWACLYLAFLDRVIRRGRWIDVVGAAISALLAMFTNYPQLFHLFVLSCVILAVRRREIHRAQMIRLAAVAGAIALAITPLLLAFVSADLSPSRPGSMPQGTPVCLAVNWFVPWFWGQPGVPRPSDLYAYAIVLALAALILAPRRALPWLVAGLLYVAFSLGPYASWYEGQDHLLRVPLPFAWMWYIVPVFRRTQFPTALLAFGLIGFAPVIGWGLAAFMRKVGRRWGVIAGVAVLAAGVVELSGYFQIHISPQRNAPSFFKELARDPEPFAMIEVPFNYCTLDVNYLYAQTVHGKALLNGLWPPYFKTQYPATARQSNAVLQRIVAIQQIFLGPQKLTCRLLKPDAAAPATPEEYARAMRELRDLHVRYIIVHVGDVTAGDRIYWFPREGELTEFLVQILGQPVHSDQELMVFDLRRAPAA